MKEAKKDVNRKCLDRMTEMRIGYAQLADKLRAEGVELNVKTVYRYLNGKESPNKSVKKAIAKVLNCLVCDIF